MELQTVSLGCTTCAGQPECAEMRVSWAAGGWSRSDEAHNRPHLADSSNPGPTSATTKAELAEPMAAMSSDTDTDTDTEMRL
jgi:hypothetical protein